MCCADTWRRTYTAVDTVYLYEAFTRHAPHYGVAAWDGETADTPWGRPRRRRLVR